MTHNIGTPGELSLQFGQLGRSECSPDALGPVGVEEGTAHGGCWVGQEVRGQVGGVHEKLRGDRGVKMRSVGQVSWRYRVT